jgi:hypothetical protein
MVVGFTTNYAGIKRVHCKKNLMFLREDGGLTRGGIKRVHCKKF